MPLAPATKGLRSLMMKLGGLNARHEALVRRVDELEVTTLLSICFAAAHKYSAKTDTPRNACSEIASDHRRSNNAVVNDE